MVAQRTINTISRCLAGVVAALCAAAATASFATESLYGFWMDSDGEVILEIGPCGDARCGTVAWLKKPSGPDGLPLRDYRNSDPALQARPVCGLRVVSGFKRQDDGNWSEGTVYVSDLGSSYSGYAEILSPTRVKVTGYIGLPIFGESEVWSKVEAPVERCGSGAKKPALPQWTTKTSKSPAAGAAANQNSATDAPR